MAHAHRLDHTPFLVPPGSKVRLKDYAPDYSAGLEDKKSGEAALLEDVGELSSTQDLFWASKQYALVIILQALDAAGKDGMIKHVMSGVNAQGVHVFSFKAPSEEEKKHHFLWRPMRVLPSAGTIAIFNRSYYEEVLVVRVHPEFLDSQWLPDKLRQNNGKRLWESRFDDINAFEKMLVENNTLFLKFFLHVSKDEQRKRFLDRINNPEKNWKFSTADLHERGYWDDYQRVYEEMLSATSTKRAPWYIIPADKKWFARACVADIITATLQELHLEYPPISDEERANLDEAKRQLEK